MVNFLSICMQIKFKNQYNVSQENIHSSVWLVCCKSYKFVLMSRRNSTSLEDT